MSDEITPAVATNGAPDLKTVVEAFILVSDGPVSRETLATALEQDEALIEATLSEIESDYSTRGIRLQRMRDRAQFVSAPEVSEQVQKFLGLDTAPRLSPAALETLAIIAYRQPVTRPQIENIRGVNCDGVVSTLLARNLIESVGELDTVGHPNLYGTTFDFLHYFGLTSLEQLPPLPEEMVPFLPALTNTTASNRDATEDSVAPVAETPAVAELESALLNEPISDTDMVLIESQPDTQENDSSGQKEEVLE